MIQKINIMGVIIPDSYKWYYDLMEETSTSPYDVKSVLDNAQPEDQINVYIDSPGGAIEAGSDIYSLLREAATSKDVKIYIIGEACSAASIIAMAAYSEMAPTALMMIHCVSADVNGNHNDMEKMSEVLQTADEALCTAYMDKAGISKEEALAMMEAETWLTAEQAVEKGLVDAVMFENEAEEPRLVAGPMFALPSEEQLARARALKEDEENRAARNKQAATLRFETLKMTHVDENS